MKLWKINLVIAVFATLSGCTISMDSAVDIDNLKPTPEGFIFTLGRTEYRYFGMADHESRKVQRAKVFLYDITTENITNKSVRPVLQQDATSWMYWMADNDNLLIDVQRKLLQPMDLDYTGPTPLLPSSTHSVGAFFGRYGYFYVNYSTNTATYVVDGKSCVIQPSVSPVSEAQYFLSDDGKKLAVMPGRGNVRNGAPVENVKVELFTACQSKRIAEIKLSGVDKVEALCTKQNEIWFLMRNNTVYNEHHYAYEINSGENLRTSKQIESNYSFSRMSFDCDQQEFVWVEIPNRWETKAIRTPLMIDIHRYSPKKNQHTATPLKLTSQ